jgi:hypothetical protein
VAGAVRMNRLAAALLASAAALSQQALAHGELKPQYGGVVQSVRDVAYELAPHESGLVLVVEDHGNPVPTAGIVGQLVVLKGSERSEAEFKPIGGNRMLARGAQLGPGQKATAVLTMPSGRPIVIQFPAR